MRRYVIAGNWKMYMGVTSSQELVNLLKRDLYDIENIDIVVCPPFVLLSNISDMLVSSNISLGGQNLYWEKEGAFTGEVSASMLKDVGCKYVIIGHSERRQYFGENNETVNKKIKSALGVSLVPIVCVGENLSERESGKTFEVIKSHVLGAFNGFTPEDVKKCIIAYEPVWAIGTGKVATGAQAQEVHKFIRNLIKESFGEEVSSQIIIQYGGSVKPDNIEELIAQEDIDGGLIGGASLKADSFAKIVKIAAKHQKG